MPEYPYLLLHLKPSSIELLYVRHMKNCPGIVVVDLSIAARFLTPLRSIKVLMMKISTLQHYFSRGGMRSVRTAILISAVSLAGLSGCASMDGKFSSSKSENLGPFASQTIAVIGEADFGFAEQRTVYIREHMPAESYGEFLEYSDSAETLFSAITDYSMKIVNLSESAATEKEQINGYADYVAGFRKSAIKTLGGNSDDQAELVAKIREADSYLEALRTAQPLIDAVQRYGEVLLFDMEKSTNRLALGTESNVDADYTALVEYTELLEDKRNEILRALQHIYEYEDGDADALQLLVDSNVVRSMKQKLGKNPSEEKLRALETHLISRLESLSAVAATIEPDWAQYRATHAELDRLHALVLGEIRSARLSLLTWSRAHRLMASGKTDPAEWFSLSTATGTLLRAGKNAVL
jgi:hypothetical protein